MDAKITNVDKDKCIAFLKRIDEIGFQKALDESANVNRRIDEIRDFGFDVRFDAERGWEVLQFDPDGAFWYQFDPVHDFLTFHIKAEMPLSSPCPPSSHPMQPCKLIRPGDELFENSKELPS